MRQLHYSPLVTNASLNRKSAIKAFTAGMTAADIAAEWPLVFTVNAEGKLGQIYDAEIADGSGRLETRYTITAESVTKAIRKYAKRRQTATR